jgi:excinuclease ABC subunit C
VSLPFAFEHRVEFVAEDAEALLRSIPAASGIFALRGQDPASEPYLTRAADLRRRLRRILAPPEALDASGQPIPSKRLNLRSRIRFIDYTLTGSDFESTLVLYRASRTAFGPEEARRRLRLHAPTFLRITMSHAHPRVYTTNRLSKKSLAETFGPFASRAAAERYCDAVLDLFQLRRCYEDLAPFPDHPGCAYGEMNKCLRPCQEGSDHACTPAQYAAEAQRVLAFFTTRGQSLLDEVATQREAASEAMDFEAAATLHKHWEKVRAAALLADELIRPISNLRAVFVQEAAPASGYPEPSGSGLMGQENEGALAPEVLSREGDAAVFLLAHGQLLGPARLSTLGVRAVREQTAVGSSLFAQPLMLSAIPLDEPAGELTTSTPATETAPTLTPEDRTRTLLAQLESQVPIEPDIPDLCDTLSLFRRWYYRPEKQRQGEVFLPNLDGSWPIRRILNGSARVVLGPPTAAPPVDREAAKALKTKIIHAGREGVEREVPVLPKRPRTRKAITPSDISP